jgi:hypothetical protein
MHIADQSAGRKSFEMPLELPAARANRKLALLNSLIRRDSFTGSYPRRSQHRGAWWDRQRC